MISFLLLSCLNIRAMTSSVSLCMYSSASRATSDPPATIGNTRVPSPVWTKVVSILPPSKPGFSPIETLNPRRNLRGSAGGFWPAHIFGPQMSSKQSIIFQRGNLSMRTNAFV
ncbi:hypothetical protein BDV98DRAFT_575950 [Pterulicium gracile]|uniref:Secreted protein n=1 Tax=Pterulicium gracile TaxID=1884261 RepID=A0A5C3Q6C6_9AGAR|nr:hypothetical protein BDV98DRAFT_575950 [Pterula gracilis]